MKPVDSMSLEEVEAELAALKGQQAAPAPAVKPVESMSLGEVEAELARVKPVEKTLQEMHPDFTAADRLVVKNLSANEDEGMDYLRRRHPNLEISKDAETGQIRARKAGEKTDFHVLDPNSDLATTGSVWGDIKRGAGEALMDAGDLLYDIPAVLATGAATAAGGLLGGAAGAPIGGIGAIPGAMAGGAAAGAASSGGLEYLRQKLGNIVDPEMNNELDKASLVGATAGGAVSPLIFGTGGSVGGALGKTLLKNASAKTLATAQNAQRGAVSHAWQKIGKPIAKTVGSAVSGMSRDTLDVMGRRYPELKAILKDKYGATNLAETTAAKIDEAASGKLKHHWNNYSKALGDFGDEASIDIEPVKKQFIRAIRDAEKAGKGGKTEASMETANALKEAFDRIFKYKHTVEVPKFSQVPSGLVDEFGKPIMKEVEELVPTTVTKTLTKISPKRAADLSADLAEMANYNKIDPRQMIGSHIKPGTDKESRALMVLGAKLKKDLDNNYLHKAIGKDAVSHLKKWGETRNLQRKVEAVTKNGRMMFANMKNADVSSNQINSELFQKADDILGTDFKDRASLATLREVYGPGKPSFFSNLKNMRRVPAAALGGLIGYGVGLNTDTSPAATSAYGAGAGFLLGGPATMRMMVRGGRAGQYLYNMFPKGRAGAGAQYLGGKLEDKLRENPELLNSPWLNMGGQ